MALVKLVQGASRRARNMSNFISPSLLNSTSEKRWRRLLIRVCLDVRPRRSKVGLSLWRWSVIRSKSSGANTPMAILLPSLELEGSSADVGSIPVRIRERDRLNMWIVVLETYTVISYNLDCGSAEMRLDGMGQSLSSSLLWKHQGEVKQQQTTTRWCFQWLHRLFDGIS